MTSDGGLNIGSSSATPFRQDRSSATEAQRKLAVEDGGAIQTRRSDGQHVRSTDMDEGSSSNEFLGKRKESKRTSGGFLLGGSLGRSKRRVLQGEGRLKTWQDRLRHNVQVDDRTSTASPSSTRSAKSQGKAPAQHGDRQRPDSHETSSPVSDSREANNLQSGRWTPPLRSDHGSSTSQTSVPSTNSASIDPNQLIQMALTLSEGRRRAASGVYTPPAAKASRRIASLGGNITAVPPGSPLANDTIRRSRMQHLVGRADMPLGPDAILEREGSEPVTTSDWSDAPTVTYDFSISSLQRAERAKKYFELCHHYRRFLQTLPPLEHTGSSASRANTDNTTVQGRVGRQYNPLQYLRNERLRQRHEPYIGPSPEDFENVQQVSEYVNATERMMIMAPAHDLTGHVALPSIQQIQGKKDIPNAGRHSRNNTASSRILWFDSSWSVTPMAMFADTVWTEDPHNKWALEDRSGRRIFPLLKPPSSNSHDAHGGHRRISGKRNRGYTLEHPRSPSKHPEHRGRHKRKFLSIHRLESEAGKKLHWHRGRSQSSSRGSSRSSTSAFGTFGNTTADGINIGPLVRHMQREMQQADVDSASDVGSPDDRWDGLPTEMVKSYDPMNGKAAVFEGAGSGRRRTSRPAPLDLRRSQSYTEGLNDSLDPFIGADGRNDLGPSSTDGLFVQSAGREPLLTGFDRNHTRLSDNIQDKYQGAFDPETHMVQQMDFAAPNVQAPTPQNYNSDNDRDRKSFESAASISLQRPLTNGSISSLRKTATNDAGDAMKLAKGHTKKLSRIIKGSRIAELVRGDGGRRSERDARRDMSAQSGESALMDEPSDGTDLDDDSILGLTKSNATTTSLDRMRNYDQLPSFKFPNGIDLVGTSSETSGDHVFHQQLARKEQIMLSRHSSRTKILPRIDIPSDKKAEKEYSKDLSSPSVRSLLSPIKRFRSTNSARSIRASPSTSNIGSSVSLAATEQSPRAAIEPRHKMQATRRWSIANELDRATSSPTQIVSLKDVERIKALYLSSGIKACELCRRAEAPSAERMEMLAAAESTAGRQMGIIPMREEFRAAGKLWHEAIDGFHKSSEKHMQEFRDTTIPDLRDKIERLRHLVGEELTVRVQTTSDEAEAFAADLTTHQTLAIKTVHDAIDGLLRGQRRKFRWLRRIGFSMLEWLVVTIMWFFWFIFVLLRVVKCTIRGCGQAIGWLLWMPV